MITYEYQDKVLKPGEQIEITLTSSSGPAVTIIVDPDMLDSLHVMHYPSLRSISSEFVIRRRPQPREHEAFVKTLNRLVVKKILAELNHCQEQEIELTMIPACPSSPDFNELARMLAQSPEYWEQEGVW